MSTHICVHVLARARCCDWCVFWHRVAEIAPHAQRHKAPHKAACSHLPLHTYVQDMRRRGSQDCYFPCFYLCWTQSWWVTGLKITTIWKEINKLSAKRQKLLQKHQINRISFCCIMQSESLTELKREYTDYQCALYVIIPNLWLMMSLLLSVFMFTFISVIIHWSEKLGVIVYYVFFISWSK